MFLEDDRIPFDGDGSDDDSQRKGEMGIAIAIKVDPLKKFTHIPRKSIISSAGDLVHWLVLALGTCAVVGEPMNNTMDSIYAHGGGIGSNMNGRNNATMDDDGTYHFPGDPPQYPIMSLRCPTLDDGPTAFIYNHAFLAWKDHHMDEYHRTRMV